MNHHSEIHDNHEPEHAHDHVDPNAEFSCANFRFWQGQNSQCVAVDEVKDSFYDSLCEFAKNAGFPDRTSQMKEVDRIAMQVCLENNKTVADIATNADLR